MSLLAIDIGTTGCKAGTFSIEGRQLGTAYREYQTLYPGPGLAELDSRAVFVAVKAAIGEAAASSSADPVTALCVSAMGEAAVPVSSDRRILGNSILSLDARGQSYIDQLLAAMDQEPFYAINPNCLSANYTLPKILWLRDHRPDLYRETRTFLLWDGLIGHLLGCEPFISYSHANRTLLFDVRREDWSETLISVTGVDRAKLPRCLPSGSIAGTVSDAAAREFGLPRGVKVVVGGHDQCCCSLGAGVAAAGSAVDGIGTFECITPVYDQVPESPAMLRRGLNVEHHVLPGLYVSFIYNQAGSLVRWFRDTFAGEVRDTINVYDRLTREMPDEPTALLVLPYFETTGAPGFVGDAAGVIAGLRTSTTRGEILKGLMESSTYWFVEHIKALGDLGIDTSRFVATGGGARSDQWLQIKADIFGVPITRPANTECGLTGAAILAGMATGVYRTAKEGIGALVRYERSFEPDDQRHAYYVGQAERYGEMFTLMHPFLRKVSGR